MTAYYNEIDPYAAEWLRKLISAGHIAAGDVDTRSIADVAPDDLRKYRQCHFFAGIGVWSYALRLAGWPDDRLVWTGSCPCQPFSAAGRGEGFADERHLWPAWHHLIAQCGPAIVFGEQVASKAVDAWIDLVQDDMEGLGYAFGAIPFPSASVGAPHIRDRAWFVADSGRGQRDGIAKLRRFERNRDDAGRAQACGELKSCGDDGVLADAASQRWDGSERLRTIGEKATRSAEASERRTAGIFEPEGVRATGELADSHIFDGYGTGSRSSDDSRQFEGSSAVCGESDFRILAVADGGQFGQGGRLQRDELDGQQPGDGGSLREGSSWIGHNAGPQLARSGPTNGFWRDADWLHCRDGRWRPVEPGTFPLAHGSTARVGRLRAYGNAINAEAAAAFIGAYCDAARA